MALAPTPENLRAEIARHRINKTDLALEIDMHPNLLSMYLNASRPMHEWAMNNIALGINRMVGVRILATMQDGYMKGRPGPIPGTQYKRSPLRPKAQARATGRRRRATA